MAVSLLSQAVAKSPGEYQNFFSLFTFRDSRSKRLLLTSGSSFIERLYATSTHLICPLFFANHFHSAGRRFAKTDWRLLFE